MFRCLFDRNCAGLVVMWMYLCRRSWGGKNDCLMDLLRTQARAALRIRLVQPRRRQRHQRHRVHRGCPSLTNPFSQLMHKLEEMDRHQAAADARQAAAADREVRHGAAIRAASICMPEVVSCQGCHHIEHLPLIIRGRDLDLPGPGPGSRTFRKFWQVPDLQPIFQTVGLHGSCSTLGVGLCKWSEL